MNANPLVANEVTRRSGHVREEGLVSSFPASAAKLNCCTPPSASLRGRFFLVLFCFLAVLLPAHAAGKKALKALKTAAAVSDLSDALFATNAPIRTFRIEVTSNELAALQKDVRAYVRGTVTEGSQAFREVGIHLKGNGSFQPLNQKPSFVAKFDRYVPDQHYLGLSKIMLNNSVQDSTYLAEFMATGMFRDAHVPSPRVTHSRVIFNGHDLGLYVCIEAENKEFLKRWFHNHSGNLYENYLQDIDVNMDQDNGNDTSQADVKRLAGVTKMTDPAARWDKLRTVLDVDGYVSHLACEMFASHTDGYAMNRNNYRIYDDPATGRFTFIGHGLDWGYANSTISIQPPQNSLVTKAVLQTPQGYALYQERVRTLFTNVFKLDVLTNRVNVAVSRLVSYARNTNEASQFIGCGREMNNRLVARYANVADQLSYQPAPVIFDAAGFAPLKGWHKKTDTGTPRQQEERVDAMNVLSIQSSNSACIASWRVRVQLAPGQYEFEGKARGRGISVLANDIGLGAGLRISGEKRENKLIGESGWTHLKYDIAVAGGPREVELVCELRANKGEVWFDADSLKLRKKN